MNRVTLYFLLTLGVLVVVLSGAIFRLVLVNRELELQAKIPRIIYQAALPQNSFVDSESLVPQDRARFLDFKKSLIGAESDFIEVDLDLTILTLYEKGVASTSFRVLTKGRDGSWWETPTGRYGVLAKEVNHFSSIGNVWMPWSIQFYGNFFIHGWPYHSDGTPVPQTYSGGCVRLATEDARAVFEFTKRDMPILVYDREQTRGALPLLIQSKENSVSAPALSAEAALVVDLDTDEVLLNKNASTPLPIASLTKLMTGVVASELIYLERSIMITPSMLTAAIQSYPFEAGERYKAFDLLYPLLMQSSNGSAKALAAFLGEKVFVKQMNEKARSIGMADTVFADPAGMSAENVATLHDLAKLSKYILQKRKFLFDVTRGKPLDVFGRISLPALKDLKNYNEFSAQDSLVGMKNGETLAAHQTILSVWHLKHGGDGERALMIGLLGSEDRSGDTTALLRWLEDNFGLQ